ncbi:MAG: extracellular solute-binding protein [Marinosulfonomonas sp.]
MLKLKALVSASVIAMTALPAAAQQEVIWWDFLGGGDGVRMKALIDTFNSEQSDIKITATTLEWGLPFYTKVRTSAAVGEAPDVMTYHLSRSPLGLQEGVLSPITDDDLAVAGLSTSDFYPTSIAAATADDTLYAIPFDIHALIMYYDKDLLAGSPYLDADGNLTGIDTYEEFGGALAWLKEQGVASPLSYASADGGTTWRIFYSLFSQQGGQFIVDGQVLPGDNLDKAVAAVEAMANWRANDYTPELTEYPASIALFTAGDAAFHFNGVWEVPTFTDLAANDTLGFEWGANEIPPLMGQEATWSDSHAFAIPNQGDETISGEKREAVMKVIGWMEKNAISWATAGHIPAYLPVTNSGEYKGMEPNATYASLAQNSAFDPQSVVTGVGSPTYDAISNLIVPAVQGLLPAQDAVEQMQQELQSMLR